MTLKAYMKPDGAECAPTMNKSTSKDWNIHRRARTNPAHGCTYSIIAWSLRILLWYVLVDVTSWRHPKRGRNGCNHLQACRYGSGCREQNNEDHCLLFLHPSINGTPRRGPSQETPRRPPTPYQVHGHNVEESHEDEEDEDAEAEAEPIVAVTEEKPAEATPVEAKSSFDSDSDKPTDNPSKECVVCFDATINSLLYPCGHVAVCQDWYV